MRRCWPAGAWSPEGVALLQSLTLVALVSRSAELADAWVRAIDARPEFQPL